MAAVGSDFGDGSSFAWVAMIVIMPRTARAVRAIKLPPSHVERRESPPGPRVMRRMRRNSDPPLAAIVSTGLARSSSITVSAVT